MDKEMKKLLLVAVSVGVFLLVTITVSLVVFTPGAQIQESAFTSSVPHRQITDILSNIPALPGITEFPEITFTEERTEVVIADRNDGDRLLIQIPTPNSPAIPEITITSTTRTQPAAPTTPAVTTRTTPTVTTTQPAATTRTTQTTTTRPATTRTVNDYWIQTGAFSAIVRAEDAKNLLASKGLVSIIENREVNGRLWYRVRLGPYTTEREANHWLAIVKEIDGFGESQVRQTVRQQ